jgi:catechol 2,3-dioxygenase-like lactoylglutathione lyase family enzyme
MIPPQTLTPILPCNDLNASETFYARLGFARAGGDDSYRILSNGHGADLHLVSAIKGWLVPGFNPFGLYLYVEHVDDLAATMGRVATNRPWGMYEFAVSDPDQTLVRIGWPSRLRTDNKLDADSVSMSDGTETTGMSTEGSGDNRIVGAPREV